MVLVDLLLVLVIAAILTVIFSAGLRRHRGTTLIAFFVLLLALTWAAGVWIAPIGTPIMGGYWLSFLIAGLIFTLLLLALMPPGATPPQTRNRSSTANERVIFGTFFWVLLVLLALIIIFFYFLHPNGPIPEPDRNGGLTQPLTGTHEGIETSVQIG